jgi:hypothetical protein
MSFDIDKPLLEEDRYRLALLNRIRTNTSGSTVYSFEYRDDNYYPAGAYIIWLQGCLDKDQNYIENMRREVDEYIRVNMEYAHYR